MSEHEVASSEDGHRDDDNNDDTYGENSPVTVSNNDDHNHSGGGEQNQGESDDEDSEEDKEQHHDDESQKSTTSSSTSDNNNQGESVEQEDTNMWHSLKSVAYRRRLRSAEETSLETPLSGGAALPTASTYVTAQTQPVHGMEDDNEEHVSVIKAQITAEPPETITLPLAPTLQTPNRVTVRDDIENNSDAGDSFDEENNVAQATVVQAPYRIIKFCGFELKTDNKKRRQFLLCGSIFIVIVIGTSLGVYFGLKSSPTPTTPTAAPFVISSSTPSVAPTQSAIPTISAYPSFAPSPYDFRWYLKGQRIVGEHFEEHSSNAVDLSADGLTIAVASRNYNNGTSQSNMGNVKVFTYTNSTNIWEPLGNTLKGEQAGVEFGASLALSSNGRRIFIGSPFSGIGGNVGKVEIYDYDVATSDWVMVGSSTQQRVGDAGESVATSSDGRKVIVGAPNGLSGDTSAPQNTGWVYILYEDTGSSSGTVEWKHEDTLTTIGDETGDQFGFSVALSSDGLTYGVSSIGHDNSRGKVEVKRYNNADGTYNRLGSVLFGDAEADQFGHDIALSADASILAIGIPTSDVNGEDSGSVKVFRYNKETLDWVQMGDEVHGEAAGDLCGTSVALSSDGLILAMGEIMNRGTYYGDIFDWTDSGNVRVFSYDNERNSWMKIGKDIEGKLRADQYGSSVVLSADGTVVAAGARYGDFNSSPIDVGVASAFDFCPDVCLPPGNFPKK